MTQDPRAPATMPASQTAGEKNFSAWGMTSKVSVFLNKKLKCVKFPLILQLKMKTSPAAASRAALSMQHVFCLDSTPSFTYFLPNCIQALPWHLLRADKPCLQEPPPGGDPLGGRAKHCCACRRGERDCSREHRG